MLGKESPAELAKRLVTGTKLKDVAVRKQLWEGGKAAVAASQDPMIVLVRSIDPDARAVRKMYEDEIESVEEEGPEAIAQARFAVEGTSSLPRRHLHAAAHLRRGEGLDRGQEGDPALHHLRRAPSSATPAATPFALPQSWLDAKPRLDLRTPFNFVATTDIIGGNSGSPVDRPRRRVVGLVFDGNIWSLGGDYGFDETVNRTVAVDTAGLTEALDKIYGADPAARGAPPGGCRREVAAASRTSEGPVPARRRAFAFVGRGLRPRHCTPAARAIIRSSARRAPSATSAGTTMACFPRSSESRTMTTSIIFMYGQCMRQPRQPSATTNSLSG